MKNINLIRPALFLLLAAFVLPGIGQTLPFRLKQNHFTGLSSPVFLTHAGDGTRRIFIVQQRGIIKVAQPGSTSLTDYLNLTGTVSTSGNERGLLGLAFHPQFETNRRFFVYYTRQTGTSSDPVEIAEYEQSASNPNIANPTAIRVIISIPHPGQTNHNGGTIAFGPDGYLYAGPGDGGSGNDPPNNAQNINALLGKMLRIDINTPVGQTPAYNIPPTNPFAGPTAGADEIFAYGLRNPYRFSFDRGGTNQLWVGDVGQGAIEEVNVVTLGGNFGWRVFEGTQCTNLDPSLCPTLVKIPPVFEYNRVSTPRCSVTGGYVYRGGQRALPNGAYVYGDYCSGEILIWRNNQQQLQLDTSRNISSFGEDEDGEIYVVGLGGTVDKLMGNRTSADFDGDLKADRAVFRPSDNTWYRVNSSNGGISTVQFGLAGDSPVPEDFDGDGLADISVFRSSNATWYSLRSSDGTFTVNQFGQTGDIPTAGDFDADGKADLTLFRPSNGTWISRRSTDLGMSSMAWGLTGDIPVPADFDGDNRFDFTVFRPSNGNWYTVNSTNGSFTVNGWGLNGDVPAQGDFDGDGKADLMVFRPTSGEWYLRRSSTNAMQVYSWGLNGDIPVAGDFDGDLIDDVAVFRPSNGVWYWIGSATGISISSPWGLSGDQPVPRYDTP